MLFQLVVAVAAIIIGITAVSVCIAAGRNLGLAQARREQSFIDADTYHRLGNFVRSVLAPPADVDEFVVLPEHLQREAEELIKKIGTAPRLVRRK